MYFALVFLLVFVALSALLLLKYANTQLPMMPGMPNQIAGEQNESVKISGWIRKVADLKASADVLPVNFMYLEINDNYPKEKAKVKKINYELEMPRCTEYSLFCMRRLAASMDIDLNVAKLGDSQNIFIAAPSAAAANSFVSTLKEQYNINSKIKAGK